MVASKLIDLDKCGMTAFKDCSDVRKAVVTLPGSSTLKPFTEGLKILFLQGVDSVTSLTGSVHGARIAIAQNVGLDSEDKAQRLILIISEAATELGQLNNPNLVRPLDEYEAHKDEVGYFVFLVAQFYFYKNYVKHFEVVTGGTAFNDKLKKKNPSKKGLTLPVIKKDIVSNFEDHYSYQVYLDFIDTPEVKTELGSKYPTATKPTQPPAQSQPQPNQVQNSIPLQQLHRQRADERDHWVTTAENACNRYSTEPFYQELRKVMIGHCVVEEIGSAVDANKFAKQWVTVWRRKEKDRIRNEGKPQRARAKLNNQLQEAYQEVARVETKTWQTSQNFKSQMQQQELQHQQELSAKDQDYGELELKYTNLQNQLQTHNSVLNQPTYFQETDIPQPSFELPDFESIDENLEQVATMFNDPEQTAWDGLS